jgi:hypothetical protein
VACLSAQKTTTQTPQTHHAFTTNSPRFYHRKTPKNRKTPSKKPLFPLPIFPAQKIKNPRKIPSPLPLFQPIGKAGEPACCAESCIT